MIKINNLKLKRDDFTLQIPTLEIKDNINFIIGGSGSGKSTLIRTLCGLERSFNGDITYDDKNLKNYFNSLYDLGIFYMSQDSGLWPHLSIYDHLKVSMGKEYDKDKVLHLLQMVKLEDKLDKKPIELSGGEQQRVAIARALSTSPKYLFLDEPFANLDVVLADELFISILELQKEIGFKLINVTHSPIGIELDKVNFIVIKDGSVVSNGYLDKIKQSNDEWTKRWLKLFL